MLRAAPSPGGGRGDLAGPWIRDADVCESFAVCDLDPDPDHEPEAPLVVVSPATGTSHTASVSSGW